MSIEGSRQSPSTRSRAAIAPIPLPPEQYLTPANVRRFFEAYRNESVGGLCATPYCPLEFAALYVGLTGPRVGGKEWTCMELDSVYRDLDPVLSEFVYIVDREFKHIPWRDFTGQQCLDALDTAARRVAERGLAQ